MTTPQFEFIATPLEDVFVIQKSKFKDERGVLIKTFTKEIFDFAGLSSDFKESHYSFSKRNVLRGMHFQKHPYGHAKLITVIQGEILDVCVGIGGELNKKNIGKYFGTILSKENNKSLYIPDGYAHGFLCLSKTAIVMNHMTKVYNPKNDDGIHYSSFGFIWPTDNVILSSRDRNLESFSCKF